MKDALTVTDAILCAFALAQIIADRRRGTAPYSLSNHMRKLAALAARTADQAEMQ